MGTQQDHAAGLRRSLAGKHDLIHYSMDIPLCLTTAQDVVLSACVVFKKLPTFWASL